ncbi:hypothetical protein BGZ75_006616 [Mortierella antarctica]|nr:hypothetical protein BGZ75_006616 [Mortierella antarctica]
MRFTTLSLVLTLSAVLSATTCHGQGTTAPSEAPTADSTELDHPRLVYSKESKSPVLPPSSAGPAQMMDAAADDQTNPTPLRRRRHLYDLSHPQKRQHIFAPKEQPVQLITRNFKRQAPRRLAGEKREGGLLDDLVGGKKEDLAGGQVPPAGTTPAQEPTPSEDVQSKSGSINLMERQEAEDESAQDEESGATDEEDSSDTEQKSATSGLDPLGQALEDVTKSSDGSDSSSSAPSEDATDSGTTPTSDEDGETPTSTPEEASSSSEPTSEILESDDTSVPPPADPVVSISSDDGTDSNGVDPNGPQQVAPSTISEPPPASGAAEPTATHNANADAASEANKEGTKTSIMIGVVAAALLLAAALCVWIFRKLKLSPSRHFRGKMGSGGAAGGVHARNNYGAGHEDGSDYNSYDGFYRGPESPLPMMAHAAGPSVFGGMAMSSSSNTGATDGVGPYPSQNLAHMSMSSESMTDYQQYSYGDGSNE